MSVRVELIKTFIHSTVHFWMQIGQIPKKSIISQIESICLDFLWKDKTHQISWLKVCMPKSEWVLGLRNLHDVNSTISMKLM